MPTNLQLLKINKEALFRNLLISVMVQVLRKIIDKVIMYFHTNRHIFEIRQLHTADQIL